MEKNLNKWRTFPLEGNHDFGSVPNSQDFETTDPLLPFLGKYFKKYIDEDALAQFEKTGYYTTKF